MNAAERRKLEEALDDPRRLRAVAAELIVPKPKRVTLVLRLPLFPFEPDTMVRCDTLHCRLPAHVCVTRQKVSDVQRSHDVTNKHRNRQRGFASDYPLCVTERCAQGRHYRSILDPTCSRWTQGAGPGHRFVRRCPTEAQEAARRRLEAVGLLDEVPTVDGDGLPSVGEDA